MHISKKLASFCLSLLLFGCTSVPVSTQSPDTQPATPPDDSPVVFQKPAEKDFVILNFTDTQMNDGEWNPGSPYRAILMQTMEELIARVKPDLITITGDLAWANCHKAYECLASYLDTFCIPWAPVWGNHDNQDGYDNLLKISRNYQKHPYCILKTGPKEMGCSNYIIRIEENSKPVTALFMMDTHDRVPNPTPEKPNNTCYAKLLENQLDWYKKHALALKDEGCNNAAIVIHIPIYAYRPAIAAAFNSKFDAKKLTYQQTLDGSCWNEGYKDSIGVKHEGIGSHPKEDGALDAILATGLPTTVLSGHEHVNNFIINYKGVKLVYSTKTGAGCYWEPQINGGTVITIGSNGIKDIHHEFVNVDELAKKLPKKK